MPEGKINFFSQPQEQAVFCTVYSLANAILFKGQNISNDLLEEWKELILSGDERSNKLLNGDRVALNNLLEPFGLRLVEYYPPVSKENFIQGVRAECIIEDILNILLISPIYFSIPSLLSKRDRQIDPKISYRDLNSYSGQRITHAVLLIREGDECKIIDPYKPKEPETFLITDPKDKSRLLFWLFSTVNYQGNEQSADEIFKKTKERLSKFESLKELNDVEYFIGIYFPRFYYFDN